MGVIHPNGRTRTAGPVLSASAPGGATKLRPVHMLVPCLERHDAIGNDVLKMREALDAAGYPVRIFAEGWNSSLGPEVEPLDPTARRWRIPEALLIYHHSTQWPRGEQVLQRTANRIVVRYHNVTPPRYFEPYSREYAEACRGGLESTARLARLPGASFWCDSSFNASELVALGAPWERCRTLAPFHRIDEMSGAPPDLSLFGELEHRTVLLFTGGVKPNKGHRALLEMFAYYHQRKNPRSVLLIAGAAPEPLRGYAAELRALAESLGVARAVYFTGTVSEGALRFFYQAADVFVCASEHEGFCVPLVEAMAFRLPIVARACTAVPETVGPAGLLVEDGDRRVFAEAVHYLVGEPRTALRLGLAGAKRYRNEFSVPALDKRLIALVEEMDRVAA